jgi:hypothetical protein
MRIAEFVSNVGKLRLDIFADVLTVGSCVG